MSWIYESGLQPTILLAVRPQTTRCVEGVSHKIWALHPRKGVPIYVVQHAG